MTRTLSVVLLAASAACSYSYQNPSESLRAGEVGGRAVVAAVPQPGVAVSVKGSTLAQGTRPTGRFLLLPLPSGNHTLLLRNGAGGVVARDVELRYGRDGQPEGVWLGDVTVPPSAATATIAFTLRSGSWSEFPNGTIYDALTGATSSFRMLSYGAGGTEGTVALSLGTHVLTFTGCNTMYAVPCQIGGPVTVSVGTSDLGFVKTLAAVTMHLPTTATGRLKVRLSAIGAVDLAAYGLTLNGAAQARDSTGLADLMLPEGVYTVSVSGPTAAADLPPAVSAAVIADEVTDLGTLYVTAMSASSQTTFACAGDADCAPGVCVGGACQGAFVPPVVTPASVPFCESQARGSCSVGQPCGLGYASVGSMCMDGGGGVGVCVAQGTCCTLDGVSSVCAPAP